MCHNALYTTLQSPRRRRLLKTDPRPSTPALFPPLNPHRVDAIAMGKGGISGSAWNVIYIFIFSSFYLHYHIFIWSMFVDLFLQNLLNTKYYYSVYALDNKNHQPIHSTQPGFPASCSFFWAIKARPLNIFLEPRKTPAGEKGDPHPSTSPYHRPSWVNFGGGSGWA